jgi:small subunit ribosomal protein S17
MSETKTETKPAAAAAANKNEKIGQVVSNKMTKTIVVEVTRRVPHPLYKRIITKRSKFYAHDEQDTAKTGDTVRIIEARPMSHLKRWNLVEVLRRAVDVGSTAADQAREAMKSVKKSVKKKAKR